MNLTLRPATSDDALRIHAMQSAAFAPLYARYGDEGSPALETLGTVAARLATCGYMTYIIEAGTRPLGAICIVLSANVGGGKRQHRMFLAPKHQGRGWAQAAIREVDRLHGAQGWELDAISTKK